MTFAPQSMPAPPQTLTNVYKLSPEEAVLELLYQRSGIRLTLDEVDITFVSNPENKQFHFHFTPVMNGKTVYITSNGGGMYPTSTNADGTYHSWMGDINLHGGHQLIQNMVPNSASISSGSNWVADNGCTITSDGAYSYGGNTFERVIVDNSNGDYYRGLYTSIPISLFSPAFNRDMDVTACFLVQKGNSNKAQFRVQIPIDRNQDGNADSFRAAVLEIEFANNDVQVTRAACDTGLSISLYGQSGARMCEDGITAFAWISFRVEDSLSDRYTALSPFVRISPNTPNSTLAVLGASLTAYPVPRRFLETDAQCLPAAKDLTVVELNGQAVAGLAFDLNDGESADVTFSGGNLPYFTITAKDTLPDGKINRFQGSMNLTLGTLDAETQLPDGGLVWSGTNQVLFEDFAYYLFHNYGLYLDENELNYIGIGDHGSGLGDSYVNGDIITFPGDIHLRFLNRSGTSSSKFKHGSGFILNLATSNSKLPPGSMQFKEEAPDGFINEPYAFTFEVKGGKAPYTYSIETGTPPYPINPATGVMSDGGAPLTSPQSFSWVLKVKDRENNIATKLCQVNFEARVFTFDPPTKSLKTEVGTPFLFHLGVSGGIQPYEISVYLGELPEDRVIDASNGGTVTATFEGSAYTDSSTHAVGIRIKDRQGIYLQQLFSIDVADRDSAIIKASLKDKVEHWYETPLSSYKTIDLHESNTVYDLTAKSNMEATGDISGVTIGNATFDQGWNFDGLGAYLESLTSAYPLNDNFCIMSLLSFNVDTEAGQYIWYKGGGIASGFALKVGQDGSSLEWSIKLNGVNGASVVPFSTQIPSGNWYQVFTQLKDTIPEMEVFGNAGEILEPLGSTFVSDTLHLSNLASDWKGYMAFFAMFKDKLWSDERKWLYNNGSYRRFKELNYWPELTLTGNYPDGKVGEPYSADLTIDGGLTPYLYPRVISGILPDGLHLTVTGNKLRLEGIPTAVEAGNDFHMAVNDASNDTIVKSQSITIQPADELAVTWDPDKLGLRLTLSNGNLTVTHDNQTGSTQSTVGATLAREASNSNHYFEINCDLLTSNRVDFVGIGSSMSTVYGGTGDPSLFNDCYVVRTNGGYIYNGSYVGSYAPDIYTGDVVGILLKNGSLYFSINGNWIGDPIAETGAAFTGLSGLYVPLATNTYTTDAFTGHFRNSDFVYPVPAGSKAWNVS